MKYLCSSKEGIIKRSYDQPVLEYSVFASCMEMSPFCGKGNFGQNRDATFL